MEQWKQQWHISDDGFTFRGRHTSEFGVTYVASPQDLGEFSGTLRIEAETPDGMDGGYWFDATTEPRVFTRECLYEDISTQALHDIRRWLDYRQQGELIFDDRPYLAYKVRPTKNVVFTDYPRMGACADEELHSGTFTLELTAYDPFARVIPTYIPTDGTESDIAPIVLATVSNELMVLQQAEMPAAPTTTSTEFLMYNCGNQYAHTVIQLAGEGDVTLTNLTTGQVCEVTGLTNAATTTQNKWIELDSATGRCVLTDGTTPVLDYSYHDYGYIVISPCDQFYRNLEVTCTGHSDIIESPNGEFSDWMVGKFIFVDEAWREIIAVNSSTQAQVDTAPNRTRTRYSNVVVMNRIQVSGGATLTKFTMTCTPRAQ